MKKRVSLGKVLLIFGLIALISAVAFGVSVVALGVTDNNYGISINGTGINLIGGFSMGKSEIRFNDNGNVTEYEFEANKDFSAEFDGSQVKDVTVSIAKCEANVISTSGDRIKVNYTTGNGPLGFEASVKDGKLVVEEKGGFMSWFSGNKTSRLTLEIPDKLYSEAALNIASGSLKAEKFVSSELHASIASGSVDLGVFADEIKLSVASGHVEMKNCTENNSCRDLKIEVASGSVQLDGFGSKTTKVNVASGKVTVNGISGDVNADIMSGTFTLDYSEWNGDLDVDLASGKVDVTLPAGSGIDLDLDRASGSCNVDLDGHSEKFSKDVKATIGGSNVHRVNIDAASGGTYIHN